MRFRIKSTRQPLLKRDKIHIRSVSQLLPSKILIKQPQHYLSTKLFYPHRIGQDGQDGQDRQDGQDGKDGKNRDGNGSQGVRNRRSVFGRNFGSQAGSEKLQHIGVGSSLDKYQLKQNQKSDRVPNIYNSTQLKKRSTMPHFRYRSLDMTAQKASKTMSNKMWTAIHYQYMPSIQKPIPHPPPSQSPNPPQKQVLKPTKKIDYLKKGSNINKRVVVNLLKLKLLKNAHQQQQNKTHQSYQHFDNTIRNNQILRMIKIYKGYGQDVESAVRLGLEKKNRGNDRVRENGKKGEDDVRDQLDIKTFPFRNLNIELSVSQWRNKKYKGGESSPLASDLDQKIQYHKM